MEEQLNATLPQKSPYSGMQSKPHILFWPEAHAGIGMGHFMECLALAQSYAQHATIHFAIAPYEPALKILNQYREWSIHPIHDSQSILQIASSIHAQWAILNHRRVTIESQWLLQNLKPRPTILVIDQLGHRPLNCDWIVNSSPIQDWLCYPDAKIAMGSAFGPSYCILKSEFQVARQAQESFAKPPHLVITLGGVDRTGASLRTLEAFANSDIHGWTCEWILGPGYPFVDEFMNRFQTIHRPDFQVFHAIQDMPTHLARASLAISAGGNSMFEMAYLGVPSLVLWEDPHEETLGKAMVELGCAQMIGNGISTPLETIESITISMIQNSELRHQMSNKARSIYDGLGPQRIWDLLNRQP